MSVKYQLPNSLNASWLRSQNAGLSESYSPDELRLAKAELKMRHQRYDDLIQLVKTYAYPLFEQLMAHTSCRLILSDIDGFVIDHWGIDKFADKLANVALESGVNWLEQYKGTNAIGTAIAIGQAVSVVGEQHYIKHHRFMSCSACPIFSPQGEMVAVLDITSEQQRHNQQAMSLVASLAQQVEIALLCRLPQSVYRIDLAAQPHLLHSGWQGIVVADEEGKVLGHNPMARQLIKQLEVGQSLTTHLGEQWLSKVRSANLRLHMQTKTLSTPKFVHARPPAQPKLSGFKEPSIQRAWLHALKVIEKSIPLLIYGETGVGKEQFVKRLHQASQRANHVLQAVNCAALPHDLVESELFGYQAGAFTGAAPKGALGKIRQAAGGFLFLDEIGEMSLSAQTRLLRVLQEREVVPVGGHQAIAVDVQVVAATHVNLKQRVQQGLFREDLYYRLNGFQLTLPALRERRDIQQMIEQIHLQHCHAGQRICPQLLAILCAYQWPGNLRELDNFMQVACLMAEHQKLLQWDDLPESLQQQLGHPAEDRLSGEVGLKQTIDENILQVYQRCHGNISQSARLLGISRNTLYRKLRRLKHSR
ncbi:MULTISPECIES: sigma-54-dependent Fis family transcriptional regulator [unclassified Agarivorans]|uniref:sigma-54-dependent Fis family transcriptional regulator n=1 Tax=unclassified Agarivorans TaxID=2636026 RepID=UPI003D7DFEA5